MLFVIRQLVEERKRKIVTCLFIIRWEGSFYTSHVKEVVWGKQLAFLGNFRLVQGYRKGNVGNANTNIDVKASFVEE